MTFGDRLTRAMEDRGRFCAGIDPHPALLDAWGLTDSVNGLEKFALTAVEALAGTVAVVKPQSAFFERFGSRGVAVLEKVVEGCRERGCLVLLDVKRGDIGSTAQGYADAYLDRNSPLFVDAITVSPYLGIGSVDPMIDTALANDAGVFVLALTSNPEGPQVQHAVTADGRSVAGLVLDAVATRNAGVEGLGSIGAVVGRHHRAALRPRPWAASTSTGRCWSRASAPRAAPWTTYDGSSGTPCATCCRPARARCSRPVPTRSRCTTPRSRRSRRSRPSARPRTPAEGRGGPGGAPV